MHDEIQNQIEGLKTDDKALEKTLQKYDLDETLEAEFNAIDKQFRQLEIKYQSLKNTRRFFNNA